MRAEVAMRGENARESHMRGAAGPSSLCALVTLRGPSSLCALVTVRGPSSLCALVTMRGPQSPVRAGHSARAQFPVRAGHYARAPVSYVRCSAQSHTAMRGNSYWGRARCELQGLGMRGTVLPRNARAWDMANARSL